MALGLAFAGCSSSSDETANTTAAEETVAEETEAEETEAEETEAEEIEAEETEATEETTTEETAAETEYVRLTEADITPTELSMSVTIDGVAFDIPCDVAGLEMFFDLSELEETTVAAGKYQSFDVNFLDEYVYATIGVINNGSADAAAIDCNLYSFSVSSYSGDPMPVEISCCGIPFAAEVSVDFIRNAFGQPDQSDATYFVNDNRDYVQFVVSDGIVTGITVTQNVINPKS